MAIRFKKYFFSGLAVFLPLVLTIYVSVWALNFVESIFGKYLRPFLLENYDFYIWGIGIVVLGIVVLLCGFLVTNYIGRAVHRWAERWMVKLPLIGNIYPAFREIADFLLKGDGEGGSKLGQVVLLEWPRAGVYTIGFLTNTTPAFIAAKTGKDLVNILIPTVPNPITGFIMMVPRDQVTLLDMSVEEAVKIIVSGGVVDPRVIIADENHPA